LVTHLRQKEESAKELKLQKFDRAENAGIL
jgi:hypothetical protein